MRSSEGSEVGIIGTGSLSTYAPCAARRCEQRRPPVEVRPCLSFDTSPPFNRITLIVERGAEI